MSTGVLYIATGQKYIEEALASASSLRKVLPHIPIAIFSDVRVDSDLFDEKSILENPEYTVGDRIPALLLSPFERTLYIDADTYVCADFTDAFRLLDRFDIALTHTQSRPYFRPTDDLPESFQDYSAGIILYRKSPAFTAFTQQWLTFFHQHRQIRPDVASQPAFNVALYHSNLRIATLPTDYHCPTGLGLLLREVKILHGRKHLSEIAVFLNEHPSYQRVFIAANAEPGHRKTLKHRKLDYTNTGYAMHMFYWHKTRTIRKRLSNLVDRHGWFGAARHLTQKLLARMVGSNSGE
jgi:hypothetical protein